MRTLRQLALLLWKNFTLARRRPKSTLFELLLPVAFMAILVLIRHISQKDAKNECVGGCEFPSFSPDNPLLLYDLTPCLTSGVELMYAPASTETDALMAVAGTKLNATLNAFTKVNLSSYANEEALVDAAINSLLPGGCRFAINFTSASASAIKYQLRADSTPGGYNSDNNQFVRNWQTNFAFPPYQTMGPRNDTNDLPDFLGSLPGYASYGFLLIQHTINYAIANVTIADDNYRTQALTLLEKLRVQRMPYPEYLQDGFLYAIRYGLPMLLMLSLLFTALTIVRNIVHEKERRLKESMKMMGLQNWTHWLAWYLQALVFLLISMTIVVLETKGGSVFKYSDPTVIWVYLVFFAMASISYCFLISAFFSKASTGAAGGGVMWFVSYVPYLFIQNNYDNISVGTKQSWCLISTTGMSLGAQLLADYEARGDGLQWDNISKPVSSDDAFTFSTVLGMLLFDTILYLTLTWYIEAVFPGEYGIPRKWYFFLQPSYWCGQHSSADEQRYLLGGYKMPNNPNMEAEPSHLHAGVEIRNLRKVFNKKVAVDDTTLRMFEGQITALLGHNGAGKTTTMSCLTGLYPPTSGTAFVNGHDIRSNMDGVRESLGICPQHDVLFDTLTVEEHLSFFCKLKGVPQREIKGHVDEMIAALELPDKRQAAASTLSGGMKRKLSCAIALIGGSRVVILDEPTSGMDPAARRATWDLLTRFKSGRTILLSTHFLDEADLLGDRIAIMADGKVVCCGSSLFLKSRYGVGYHMTMTKTPQCDVHALVGTIQQHVPTATLEGNVGTEVTVLLPKTASPAFPALFAALEERKAQLGLQAYGVSVTTMEEVFLKVGEAGHDGHKIDIQGHADSVHGSNGHSGNGRPSYTVAGATTDSSAVDEHQYFDDNVTDHHQLLPVTHGSNYTGELNTGLTLKLQQLRAMFMKRSLHSRRNYSAIIVQLLLPMIFVLIALIVAKTYPGPTDSPARELFDLTRNYDANTVLYTPRANSTGPASNLTLALARNLTALTPRGSSKDQGYYELPTNGRTWGNVSSYILNTIGDKPQDVAEFNKVNMIGIMFAPSYNDSDFNTVEPLAMYNGQAYHSISQALAWAEAAIIRTMQVAAGGPGATWSYSNAPLPRTPQEKAQDQQDDSMGFTIAFTILFGMAFLASSFVVFLVTERSNKAKHIQFVSGVNAVSYWGAAYVWDFFNFMLPTIGCLILFLAFHVEAYSFERFGVVALLFVLYGLSVIPTMYLCSFLFDNASKAYTWMTIFNIVTGLAAMLTVNILGFIQPTTADHLKNAFLFMPNYCFGQGLADLYTNYQNIQVVKEILPICRLVLGPQATVQDCCHLNEKMGDGSDAPYELSCETNYLDMAPPGVGRYAVCMVAEAIVYFLLVLAVERRLLTRLAQYFLAPVKPNEGEHANEDEDVARERQRIRGKVEGPNSSLNMQRNELRDVDQDDVLVVYNLSKVFGGGPSCGKAKGRKVAVDRLSFGVPRGECFGLLGVNGAGKTTTFRMLTGDEMMTAGTAFLDGYDIRTSMAEVRQRIGYCPQFDGLIELMTGRELLTMYARLRGVPEPRIPALVMDLIGMFMLEKHADKPCGTYSGGNKRKLSTAVALCGPSPVIFLDEPTTGMDPGARRFIWNALLQAIKGGRSLVLTTHSMEECEALCTRLAIMVNGRFECFGSLQHLKTRFGRGISLVVRLPPANMNDLRAFVAQHFPQHRIKDEHLGQMAFELTASYGWPFIFEKLEQARTAFGIEDYSVSQTTLEQVFVDMAKHQHEDARR